MKAVFVALISAFHPGIPVTWDSTVTATPVHNEEAYDVLLECGAGKIDITKDSDRVIVRCRQ